MTIPSTPEITMLPEIKDHRPEPPPIQDMWIVRYQECKPATTYSTATWATRTSMFARDSEVAAVNEANELIAKGCRRVQIIKIGGDA